MSDKDKGPLPIITELEPPICGKWSVQYADGTPGHIVRVTADHTLRQDIFTCDCGCKYTWSKGRDYEEPCRHVLAVTTSLLVDSGMLKGKVRTARENPRCRTSKLRGFGANHLKKKREKQIEHFQ